MNKQIKSLILVFLLLGFDQLTKYLFYDLGLLGGIFGKVFNTGIAWGVNLNIIFVIVMSFLILILFFFLFYKKYINYLELGFLVAGTLGNLVDRIFLSGVRDFIIIGNFPVFNFADIFLNIGLILIILREFNIFVLYRE